MAKTAPVTFFSNYTGYELVRQPRNDKPVPSGVGWINETPGTRYKFQPAVDDSGMLIGRLDVLAGSDVLQDTMGWLAPGEDQEITRDAPTALRAHKQYGQEFWQAPVAASLVRRRIREAISEFDEDTLVAMIAEEKASTVKRPELVAEIEDARRLIHDALVQARAHAEAEAQAQAEAETQAPRRGPGRPKKTPEPAQAP